MKDKNLEHRIAFLEESHSDLVKEISKLKRKTYQMPSEIFYGLFEEIDNTKTLPEIVAMANKIKTIPLTRQDLCFFTLLTRERLTSISIDMLNEMIRVLNTHFLNFEDAKILIKSNRLNFEKSQIDKINKNQVLSFSKVKEKWSMI